MTKQKNIPELRFPEFEGEWVERKIGNLGSIVGGGTPSKNITDYWDGTIPWISSSDLTDSNIYDIKISRYISSNALKESATKIIPCNSILIVSRVGVGKIAVNHSEICTSQDFTNLIPKDGNYIFLAYLIKQKTKKLIEFNQGTSIKGFVKGDLEDLSINLPTLSEQQKIASFFMAIDSKLDLLRKKRDLLEKYKKGVTQKIFSQEIRFKDENGNEFADWEEKKLGEVCEITMGQSPDSNSYNSLKIGLPLIQGNADINNRVSSPRNYTTQPTKQCEFGDLILTVRAPVGKVAKSIHRACIGRGVCSLKSKSCCNIEFIYQFLLEYESKWVGLEQGSTFTAVNGSDIKNIKINLPSLPEQEKIANFLSSIDTKIENLVIEIEGFENWKKGLLGRMFC